MGLEPSTRPRVVMANHGTTCSKIGRAMSGPCCHENVAELIVDRDHHVGCLYRSTRSNAGQMIYLIHHQCICEIAKMVVPGVTIHELK